MYYMCSVVPEEGVRRRAATLHGSDGDRGQAKQSKLVKELTRTSRKRAQARAACGPLEPHARWLGWPLFELLGTDFPHNQGGSTTLVFTSEGKF